MSALVPHRGGYVHADVGELTARLQYDDPRLDLKLNVIQRHGKTGRRYEVWRHNEDGSDTIVGHWRLDEYDRIEHDLAQMRGAAAGRGPSAIERIDSHNETLEDKSSSAFRDAYGEMLSHVASLQRDRDGRTMFGRGD